MRTRVIACAVLAIVASASAQTQTLTTTFASNNSQAGNMFDLVAINTVSVCSLDVTLDVGTWDLDVYAVTGGGSYAGLENNAAAWTLLASVPNVASSGFNAPTPLPVLLGLAIPAGTTQGIYVTVTNGSAINYTNGTSVGSVYASDVNLQVLEGSGNAYPFAGVFMPRVFNGNIHYAVSPGSCGSAPYQTNQAGSGHEPDQPGADRPTDPGPSWGRGARRPLWRGLRRGRATHGHSPLRRGHTGEREGRGRHGDTATGPLLSGFSLTPWQLVGSTMSPQ